MAGNRRRTLIFMLLAAVTAACLCLTLPASSPAATKVQKFNCKGVSYPGTEKTSVFVRRSLSSPKLSCDQARRVMRLFAKSKKGRVTGWTCKKGRIGWKMTIGRCWKRGYSITLTDQTLTFAQTYFASKDSVDYDYGAEINWLARRICVFHNQPPGEHSESHTAARNAHEVFYARFDGRIREVGGRTVPPAADHRSCPQSPPVDGEAPYPLRYKGLLAELGVSAVSITKHDVVDSYHHALYSEYARLYDRLRNQVLEVQPSADIVTFSEFLSKMGVEDRPDVRPEPPVQDPPPCEQSNSCG